jgi:hypothetical protein
LKPLKPLLRNLKRQNTETLIQNLILGTLKTLNPKAIEFEDPSDHNPETLIHRNLKN